MAEEMRMDGNLAVDEKQYRVITISPTEPKRVKKLRVAAYARVSTDSSDQLNSFSAQTRHFSDLISREKTWELADIYADEGITGTSAEKRGDFQRLLADCRRGLVDRVLVKSISRFARNTKECLEILRELKSLGVGVFFEKENIDTSAMSSEMMTALFASLAQEESRNISQNMRWSYQRRMQSGQFITFKYPFGYRLEEGKLKIYEPEAGIVREIFSRYLNGESKNSIAEYVTALGVPSRDGKKQWHGSAIASILRNERYTGNALLQKTYMTGDAPYRQVKNRGEKDRYYFQESHPAIITQGEFDAAQNLLLLRAKKVVLGPESESPFHRKMRCGRCGGAFKKKLIRTTVFWTCKHHDQGKMNCPITPVNQDAVCQTFLRLYFNLKHTGAPILSQLAADLKMIRERKLLWSPDIIELNTQISNLSRQNHTLAELHAQGLVDPDIFISQTNALTKQLRDVKLQKERLLSTDDNDVLVQTESLIAVLSEGPEMLTEFDAELFDELIDRIVVEDNQRLRFRLRNGLELTETMERTVR